MNDTGWNEWGKHVIYELERLSMSIGELRKEMAECKKCHGESQIMMRERITGVEVKASIFGAVSGLIAAGGALLIKYL